MSIPKIINFFWEGETLSWMRYMTLYSFKKYNPDWKITLNISEKMEEYAQWNGNSEFNGYWKNGIKIKSKLKNYMNNVEELGIKIKKWSLKDTYNTNYSEVCKNIENITPIQKSDFFSWDILSTIGGLYSDMDILYVKPIENFYIDNHSFDALFCYFNKIFPIGFLGSSENSIFYNDIFRIAISNHKTSVNESAGTETFINISKKLEKEFAEKDVLKNLYRKYRSINNIKKEVVYPWDCFSYEKIFMSKEILTDKETVGIHWYGGGSLAQEMNSILDDCSYLDTQNTFTYFADKVIKD